MKKNDLSHIWDIVNACENIISFTQEMSLEEFEEDVKTQSAVMHQFMVMGEATKRLSDDFREKHNAVPWRKMAGFRDILIHQYDNVIPDEVWSIIQESVPNLKIELEELLK